MGNTPLFTIIGMEQNGETSERIKYEDVTFDKMTLQKIVQGESHKDEMAFQAVDFEYIDR